MTALLRPPDWTRDAACLTADPLLFDADTGPAAATARTICAGCPVRHQCAIEALTQAIPTGTWGGLTPDDRRAVAALFGYDPPGLPPHGERARYVHRTQPCREACCREAHRRYIASRSHGRGHRPAADTADRRISA